jgi:hypothetical protein
MSRQIGVALGVAVLVSIVGTPAPGEAVDAFQDGYTFMTAIALAAAIGSIGRVGPQPAMAPAAVAVESA